VKLLVSFIIPVLNGEKDIRRCLTSIRDQNFAPQGYEVLVVDNGSMDRTPQVVRELGYDLKYEQSDLSRGRRLKKVVFQRNPSGMKRKVYYTVIMRIKSRACERENRAEDARQTWLRLTNVVNTRGKLTRSHCRLAHHGYLDD
jgi:glycosyltransferase involved in cell wall biosynthesis